MGAIWLGLAGAVVGRATRRATIKGGEGAGSLCYQFVHGKSEARSTRKQDGDEVWFGEEVPAKTFLLDAGAKGLKDSPGCAISLYCATGYTLFESDESKVDVVVAFECWLTKVGLGEPSLGIGVFGVRGCIAVGCRHWQIGLCGAGNELDIQSECVCAILNSLRAIRLGEVPATVRDHDVERRGSLKGEDEDSGSVERNG